MRKLQNSLLLIILVFTCGRTFAQDESTYAIQMLEHESSVNSVAWHPSGEIIATGSGNSIYFWRVETGDLIHTFQAYEGDVYFISWSPSGDRLLSIGDDWIQQTSTLKMWDADAYALMYTLMSSAVTTAHWSPDGERLVTVNKPQTVDGFTPQKVFTVWGSEIGDLKAIFRLSISSLYNYENYPLFAVWDTNEQFIGVNRNGLISIWDWNELELVNVSPNIPAGFTNSLNRSQSAAWNDSRQLLALTANNNVAQEFGVTIANLSTREYNSIEIDHSVNALAWRPDNTLLAIGDSAGTIHIWNASTQEFVETMHSGHVRSLAWSPDGLFIASADASIGTVTIWKIS